ncbi:anti-sigma factor family protein [Salibacterium halotolerans]|uniref:Anti-sigma-W factor RsiW n=1 Tax=Salibacterium halotolerans TaxID=1884432 RepID=A0A1I5TTV7_9BACI|nr:zf-HC2 domain-containing protein [Salibacterium halotolerans]SFP86502.1 Putative zinc-finger [Salibacterium halotolerans]
MTCKHLNNQNLAAYVLGEISDQEAKSIQEHLSNCPDCRSRVDEWYDLVSVNDFQKPSEATRRQVFAKTIEQNQKRRRESKKIRTGVSVAVVLSILLTILPLLNTEKQMADPVSSPSFIHNPETAFYTSATSAHSDLRGYMWVNDHTEEMYIFVEGMTKDSPRAEVHTKEHNVLRLGRMVSDKQTGRLYRRKSISDPPEFLVVKSGEGEYVKILPLTFSKQR